jgi:hypothetical protein
LRCTFSKLANDLQCRLLYPSSRRHGSSSRR